MDRFPVDFMFRLTEIEWENLKSQNAISSWGGRRKTPYAFTEYGVLMLSSVLNSDRAIQVSIPIMRIYAKLRENQLTSSRLSVFAVDNPGRSRWRKELRSTSTAN